MHRYVIACVCISVHHLRCTVQSLVSSLERSRAAMANDLAAVSGQNSELTEKVETIPQLTTKLQVTITSLRPTICVVHTCTHTHTTHTHTRTPGATTQQ